MILSHGTSNAISNWLFDWMSSIKTIDNVMRIRFSKREEIFFIETMFDI